MTTLVLEHLQHADSASPDITIDSSGNVGIGTTGPNESLHVYRASGDASFKLQNASQTLRIDQNSIRTVTNSAVSMFTNNNSSNGFRIENDGRMIIGNNSGQTNVKLTIKGNVKMGSAAHSSWANSINDIGGLDIIVGSGSTGLTVWDDNAQTTPRFKVERTGNVGIGTDSPDAPLSFGNNIPSNGQTIHTYQNGNTRSGLGIVASQHRMFTNTGSSLSYGHVSSSDGSTYTERMQITSAGHINVSSDDKQIFWGTGTTAIDASSSNNRIRFYTNNSEHVRIDSSGTLSVISSDVVLGSGAAANTGSYTSAANSSDFKRFETDGAHFNSSVFSDPAIMGPNKLCVYDDASWKGGIGLGSDEIQYYTGGAHSFYKHTGTALTKHMEITGNGAVTTPAQPHIFGTPHTGTEASSGIASIFRVKTSRGGLSFSNSRVTVAVAGVYTITYQTICQTDTGRHDTHIKVNGGNVSNGLNETNGSGYHMRTHVINMYLSANDYIQWQNARYYSDGSVFDGWTTASVTLIG